MDLRDLPTLNASLNFTSGVLIVCGYYFIRRRNIVAHRRCMVAAAIVSALFLVSYLVYHFNVGSVRFSGEGAIRMVYLTILLTHTVLAAVLLPMALRTLYLGWTGRIDKHRRIARFTLPSWIYVSATGVIVYWMLYRM